MNPYEASLRRYLKISHIGLKTPACILYMTSFHRSNSKTYFIDQFLFLNLFYAIQPKIFCTFTIPPLPVNTVPFTGGVPKPNLTQPNKAVQFRLIVQFLFFKASCKNYWFFQNISDFLMKNSVMAAVSCGSQGEFCLGRCNFRRP